MPNFAAPSLSQYALEMPSESASAARPAAGHDTEKRNRDKEAAPSLKTVMRSARVRAWVPQHLIDSLANP